MTVRPSRDHRPAWPPPSSAAGSHSLCKPAVSQSFSTKQPVNLLKLGQLQSWVHGPDWPPSPPAATKDRQVLCKICLNTCLGIFLLSPHFFAQNIFVGQTECRYAIHVSVPGSWRFISLQNIFINAQKWLDFLEEKKSNAPRECEE